MTPEQTQALLWLVGSVAALVTGVRAFVRAWRADRRRRAAGENGATRMMTIARMRRTGLGAAAALAALLILPVAYFVEDVAQRMPIARTFFLIMSFLWAARNIIEDFDDVAITAEIREQEASKQ